ncbi:AAEL013598-PA [Aedes aegypti]|uniref:AAEL013598-PA n=1 Tax=Aedes aegypti TaxID=7159 RepID=Q16IN7_AEDAE|nr:AAEL013598-PA [Aedes aegypti]
MSNDRELSQFLYNLSHEIVASKDYSDCNINQICGKYYENSTYPDRDRLRRLVSELKRKLKILQQQDSYKEIICPSSVETVPSTRMSCPATQSSNAIKFHRCACQRSRDHIDDYCPYPVPTSTLKKLTSDKCVETSTTPEVFSPAKLLISDSTQYSAPRSYESYSTGTACGNSACSNCGNLLKEEQSTLVQRSGYSARSSEDSSTLMEQLLLKHSATLQSGHSSDILLRLAAADRVLCESCHGKCPLHRCGHIRGKYEPPPVYSGKCDCGPSCRTPTRAPPTGKQNCSCPLKSCKHFDGDGSAGAGGSGGSGGLGKQGAILRQQESLTPPITCCGARRKKKKPTQQGTCRKKSSRRKE